MTAAKTDSQCGLAGSAPVEIVKPELVKGRTGTPDSKGDDVIPTTIRVDNWFGDVLVKEETRSGACYNATRRRGATRTRTRTERGAARRIVPREFERDQPKLFFAAPFYRRRGRVGACPTPFIDIGL